MSDDLQRNDALNPSQGRNDSASGASGSIAVPPVSQPSDDSGALPPTSTTTARDRRIAFAILMLATVCLGLGQTILFAILPPLARRIGLADIQVGLIFTLSALLWVLMSPVWGRLSDRIGRKPVIMIGVAMFSVSIASLGLILKAGVNGAIAPMMTFGLLVAFRSLHGAFSSAGPAASQAYVADRTAPDERTSSLAAIGAAYGLGATLGPGIGAATVQFGPVVPLFVVSGIAVASLLAIMRFLPERSRPVQRGSVKKLRMTDKRLRATLFYGVASGVLMVVPVQLTGFYLLDVLALDEVTASQLLGIVFMVSAMAALFSQLVIIQQFRPSPALLMQIAPPIAMIGYLIIALGRDFGTITFGMLVTGLGTGMIRPAYNAAVSLRVNADEQGAAAGLANSTSSMGHIVAPAIAFMLYKVSPQTPFYVSAGLALILTGYAALYMKAKPAGDS